MKPKVYRSAQKVKVTTLTDEQNDIRYFKVEGHAGYAEAGKDIVCSAISMLTISAVNGLEKYLAEPPVYKAAEGFLECVINSLNTEQDRLMARAILGTMLLGLKQIDSRYIMFEQGRWTPC